MMIRKHLSPAFVVALIALFVALSGTAVAAGIVPLATRALTADRAKQAAVADVAKKLGPQATAAMVQQAGRLPARRARQPDWCRSRRPHSRSAPMGAACSALPAAPARRL